MVSFDYIRDMPTLRVVVTENCELCQKGLKNLSFLNYFFTIKEVDAEDLIKATNMISDKIDQQYDN